MHALPSRVLGLRAVVRWREGPLDPDRRRVAQACRVLASAGLSDGLLGHVSLRRDDGDLWLRCRGPRERGLSATGVGDVHRVDRDGELLGSGARAGYRVPAETPLHTEVLRARPDVGCVVHAHPPEVVLADLAGLALPAVFGAFDIPAYRMAVGGVPVYPRSVLVRTRPLGEEVAAALGDAPACVLRGHGLVTVGQSVEQAVVRAAAVTQLARFALDLARLGAAPEPVPECDAAELPDLGAGFNDVWTYRALVHRSRRRS